MIDCTEAMRQLWEYLDGTVDLPERALVDEHLARCRRCCGERDFAIELRRLLKEPVVFDGRNLYEPANMAQLGFVYHSIGRQAAVVIK